MSSLDNTIYTREEPLDPHIRIDVHRLTVRSAEINWTPIPSNYFNTPESVGYLQISDSPTSEFETVHEITQRHPPFYIDDNFMSTYYRSPVVYYKLVFRMLIRKAVYFPLKRSLTSMLLRLSGGILFNSEKDTQGT